MASTQNIKLLEAQMLMAEKEWAEFHEWFKEQPEYGILLKRYFMNRSAFRQQRFIGKPLTK